MTQSLGPNGFPPTLLKSCRASLSRPLSRLFYTSYSSGIYPSEWKLANVQPVPKKSSRSDPANYRPVAITSIVAKIIKEIIKHNLMSYLESNGLIHDSQYGFRSKRSTGDVMAFLTYWVGQHLKYVMSMLVSLMTAQPILINSTRHQKKRKWRRAVKLWSTL